MIRDHLATTLLPRDLHQHIDILLAVANPARFAELLFFLLGSASQLSTEERKHVLQMGINDATNTETSRLLEYPQLFRTVVHQW